MSARQAEPFPLGNGPWRVAYGGSENIDPTDPRVCPLGQKDPEWKVTSLNFRQ
ncbi:hypothetical protein GCM10027562_20270 [Arthrobacter pigmenti]